MMGQNAKKEIGAADIGCLLFADGVAMAGTGTVSLADSDLGRLSLGG